MLVTNVSCFRLPRSQTLESPGLDFETVAFEVLQKMLKVSEVFANCRGREPHFRLGSGSLSQAFQSVTFSTQFRADMTRILLLRPQSVGIWFRC